jgi:hypothetical protein
VDGPRDRLTIDDPVACVIRVRGALDSWWSDRLGGLRIGPSEPPAARDGPTTELRGELLDQAALMGVLTTLYELGLPLLQVTCMPERRPHPADGAAAPGPSRADCALPRRTRVPTGGPPG